MTTFDQRLEPRFYQGLQNRLRTRMEEEGLDAILLDDWRDVAYLTGFFHTPCERPVIAWIGTDRTVLLVPELEREHADAQCAAADELVAYGEYPGVVGPFEVLAKAVGTGPGRWGHAPTMATGRLDELKVTHGDVRWSLTRTVDAMRLVKEPEEVALHRKAAELGDVMLASGRELIQQAVAEGGQLPSEAELASYVIRAGSDWMYTNHKSVVVVPMLTGGLVYAGENSAYPHGLPSGYRLRPGETFILSLGGAVGGRYAESERTFVLGEPSARQRELFAADHEAQRVGTEAIRAGATCRDVNTACLDVIRDAGFAEYLRHRQGHGIGLNFHEPPWLEDGDSTVLQQGMIVSSEPGIYVPGHAGYRISDTVLVTSDGPERLTTYPRDLDDVVVAI